MTALTQIETKYARACQRFALEQGNASSFRVFSLVSVDLEPIGALFIAVGDWEWEDAGYADAYCATSPDAAAFALLDAIADFMACRHCGRPIMITETDQPISDNPDFSVCHYWTGPEGRFMGACSRLAVVHQ